MHTQTICMGRGEGKTTLAAGLSHLDGAIAVAPTVARANHLVNTGGNPKNIACVGENYRIYDRKVDLLVFDDAEYFRSQDLWEIVYLAAPKVVFLLETPPAQWGDSVEYNQFPSQKDFQRQLKSLMPDGWLL